MATASSDLPGFNLDELSQDASGNESERVLLLSPEQCYCEEQVRTVFDESDLNELTLSLKNTWQQQAIVVHPADVHGMYKIDKGERRWRAAQNIEGFKLKAIVDTEAPHRDRQHQLLGQLVENDSRVDLPIIDMANALGELVELGLSQDEIATKLGWIAASNKPNRNKVCRILSVLKLPEEGTLLVKDNIVTDLMTLELFRRLHEANEDRFNRLCELSRENEGISRKEVEAELKDVKKALDSVSKTTSQPKKTDDNNEQVTSLEQGEGTSQQNNSSDDENDSIEPASEHNTSIKTESKSENETVRPAAVKVECLDGRKGVLVLDKKPVNSDEVFVAFDNEDMSLLKMSELKLHSLEF